jgi:hypothetical protein
MAIAGRSNAAGWIDRFRRFGKRCGKQTTGHRSIAVLICGRYPTVNLDDSKRSTTFAVGGWRQSQRAIEALAQRIPASGVPQLPSEGSPLAL